MISVDQWLRNNGVTLNNDVTFTATGVSANGSVVVGTLQNGNAYIARGPVRCRRKQAGMAEHGSRPPRPASSMSPTTSKALPPPAAGPADPECRSGDERRAFVAAVHCCLMPGSLLRGSQVTAAMPMRASIAAAWVRANSASVGPGRRLDGARGRWRAICPDGYAECGELGVLVGLCCAGCFLCRR